MDCSNPLCMANCPDDIDDFFLYIGLNYGVGVETCLNDWLLRF